ncbi:peptidoglycan bridge formation glycyltransferase FemA/FemB family protein [Bifidobacterium cuniculi]|uniref:FemAB family n=1 Tax=Bifidobacterium cuniculi TaxID=1688 RepID=A0A087AWR8_9BIFI|nr:peptidoglycan bridge formation glycyltransferase FemA/FemB family protein [Bifidobacterium cuniculi]KFI63218.1 FemAB family [Bifidobacterium cuniculi]
MTTALAPRALTDSEFSDLAARAADGNFQQTLHMRDLAHAHGMDTSFVGIVDGAGTPVTGAMVVYTHSRLGDEGSIWAGPLGDMDDAATVRALTEAIVSDARHHHAVDVNAWPVHPYRSHRSDGSADGAPDAALMRAFGAAGWQHHGFDTGYGTVINRWVYVKDLDGIEDEESLLASYSKRTQWSVKRARSSGVIVREVGEDELGTFARIEQDTANRRNFAFRGEQYFHDFAHAFGDDAHFLIASIDTAAYLEQMERRSAELQQLVDGLTAKIARRETTKLRRRLNEESSNLAAANKRLASARALRERGDLLPAACSLFVDTPQETVYLFSGSEEEFKPFYASALIQHEAMLRYCVRRGVPRYNFYGIDGVFDDPDSEGRGVLEFKQGFNGRVEELPGEFTIPVGKFRFMVRKALESVRR